MFLERKNIHTIAKKLKSLRKKKEKNRHDLCEENFKTLLREYKTRTKEKVSHSFIHSLGKNWALTMYQALFGIQNSNQNRENLQISKEQYSITQCKQYAILLNYKVHNINKNTNRICGHKVYFTLLQKWNMHPCKVSGKNDIPKVHQLAV